MHFYTTTASDHVRVVKWMSFLGIAAAVALGVVLNELGASIPPYVALPSPTVVFAALFVLYDRFLWRASVRGISLSRTPNLNGLWEGHITIRRQLARTPNNEGDVPKDVDPYAMVTNADDLPGPHDVRVRIEQTWSRISISFSTAFSTSRSVGARIEYPGSDEEGLRYVYKAEGVEGKSPKIENHDGVARLRPLDGDWSRLTGDFYSDQHYQRYGEYEITLAQASSRREA